MACIDVTLPPVDVRPKPIKLVVGVVLMDADGRVLIAERPAGKSMAGFWEFPGGHVRRLLGKPQASLAKPDPRAGGDLSEDAILEGYETPEAAAVRELKEELGIVTSAGCLNPLSFASHTYEAFHLLMPVFTCRVWQGVAEAREGQKLAWVRPHDLKNYKLLPADVPLIPEILRA